MWSVRFANFAALLVVTAPSSATAQAHSVPAELASVRAQLDKYRDPIVTVPVKGYSFAEAAPKLVHPHP